MLIQDIIKPVYVQKGSHDFIIEVSCNGMFGVPWGGDTIAPPDVCSFGTQISAVWYLK